jgi:gluconate/galactonate dehydratase
MENFNRCSSPSELKITDMRFVDIVGAPMDCTILRLDTNQGISGYGEVRDFSNKFYALELKRLLVGENPCNINKLFSTIKQFGGHARQGGGVSGIEVALWDLAGKAYGVPVYQMLGGKTRDKVRVYCDTDIKGKHSGREMGMALKKRMEAGFTMLKMDLGVDLLLNVDGALNAPLGYVDSLRKMRDSGHTLHDRDFAVLNSVPHPFTGLSFTEKGLDWLENYVSEARDIIGYEIPLSVDHLGHVNFNSCIRLAKRLEKYNIFWLEDSVPWFYTDQYRRISEATTVPICTGEDIFGRENFMPLLESHAVSIIHPDVLTAGGIGETLRVINLAEDHGIGAAIHMAETPIGCLAAASAATAAGSNFIAEEFHSFDVPWWDDMVENHSGKIVDHGFITLSPDKPGLGIEKLNDEVLAEHINPKRPGLWKSTEEWDGEWSHDRIWS